MAFRNHKFRPNPPVSEGVSETSLKVSTVDGVDISTPVTFDACSKPPLPSANDFRLSAVLASGAPLRPVSPTIFHDVDADSDAFINQLLSSDVSRDTDKNTENKEDVSNDSTLTK